MQPCGRGRTFSDWRCLARRPSFLKSDRIRVRLGNRARLQVEVLELRVTQTKAKLKPRLDIVLSQKLADTMGHLRITHGIKVTVVNKKALAVGDA